MKLSLSAQGLRLFVVRRGVHAILVAGCLSGVVLRAQAPGREALEKQVQLLTDAVNRAQDQLQQSQRQLNELRRQLDDVRRQMNGGADDPPEPSDAQQLASQVEALKEEQAMEQSEIATHEQSKVESESKYPVRVSGLILLNGFVNTSQVDMAATPTTAEPGPGSSGATMRQTVLGVEANGPHVFGASTHGDLSTDFFGTTGGEAEGGTTLGLLRLRTAHAALDWASTRLFFSLDRPMINATQPSSLTAVAIPPLAWSGNLWTWNPQIGVRYDRRLSPRERLRMQAALIDVADPPYGAASEAGAAYPASTVELGRWPGVQARLAVVGGPEDRGSQLGAGGYFSEHHTTYGNKFDSWAGTLDYRQPLPERLELSGNFYRGLALGGLGGGAYKDFGVRADLDRPGEFYIRPFDDVGGWAQMKERATERLELNGAYGIDNVPGREISRYSGLAPGNYQTLARTQTFMGNVIYSPSAWFLFSLEYRHLDSSYVGSPPAASHVIGVAAGYKF